MKPTNTILSDSLSVHTNDKTLNLNTIDKNHSKCNVLDGSDVNSSAQPITYRFVLDKPVGNKVSSQPQTVHYKKQINLL